MDVADEQLALHRRERERGHEQQDQIPAVGDVLAAGDAEDHDPAAAPAPTASQNQFAKVSSSKTAAAGMKATARNGG